MECGYNRITRSLEKWAKVGAELTAGSLHPDVHEFLHFLLIKVISLSFWLKFVLVSDLGDGRDPTFSIIDPG